MSNHNDNAASDTAEAAKAEPVRPTLGASRPRRANAIRQTIKSRRVIHHRRRK